MQSKKKKQTIHLSMNELTSLIHNCVKEELERYHASEQILSEFAIPICASADNDIRNNSTRLNESLTLFNGYNLLLKNIEKTTRQKMTNGQYSETNTTYKGEIVTMYSLHISDEDVNIEQSFFNKLDLSITMVKINQFLRNDITNLTNGSYTPNETLVQKKLPIAKIVIQCPFVGNDFITPLRRCVLHEFTHAYEDYNKLLKLAQDKQVYKLKDYTNTEYEKYQKLVNNGDTSLKRTIGSIMYHLSKTEDNAYVAQMYGDLSAIPYQDILNLDTFALLKKTTTWRRFVTIQDNINKIANDVGSSKEFNDELLQVMNDIKIGRQFKTAPTAIKWLSQQFHYTVQHMIEHFARTIKAYIADHEQNNINEMFTVLTPNKTFGLTTNE